MQKIYCFKYIELVSSITGIQVKINFTSINEKSRNENDRTKNVSAQNNRLQIRP